MPFTIVLVTPLIAIMKDQVEYIEMSDICLSLDSYFFFCHVHAEVMF